MGRLEGIINSLEVKIQELFQKMENLKLDNQELRLKLRYSESIILKQSQDLKKMKAELDAVKMTNALLGSDEFKRDTKLKINSLIKEIDYCIAQLSD
ncbi:hypothetical protein B0A78_10075 [Flavobacterium columnare NBRC 100251 = ATCC 23463]|uniref:Uncharacterized protein n=2 Tax=Flavobacterium columnare TaxID=996 RepID=A0AAI8CFI4_9FLAO|nr:hypothetical protein [Flavobacterium columnare]PDS23206.1 hypothetical protein B0A78_10075 [Flavobacterium columnare NBRC 100251 = ATCC 23463]AMO18982.1 hypothetical protein UN65_00160 [Flavobacterium columnare]APT21519.1 hypothetical protein BU993_02005 [Flavobacterium columnare]AUX16900.1 hypothetical protein AQ623_00160 [Flavobacterium columnare]MBF6652275.1 hypothetical protein [Flavobacterium columnare]